jgi:hypothetical protein
MTVDTSPENLARMAKEVRRGFLRLLIHDPKSPDFELLKLDAADMLETLSAERDALAARLATAQATLEHMGAVVERMEKAEAREVNLRAVIPPLIVIALDNLGDMNAETRKECERDIATARAALQETKT